MNQKDDRHVNGLFATFDMSVIPLYDSVALFVMIAIIFLPKYK